MIAVLIESMLGNADFSPCNDTDEEYLEGNENGQPAACNEFD